MGGHGQSPAMGGTFLGFLRAVLWPRPGDPALTLLDPWQGPHYSAHHQVSASSHFIPKKGPLHSSHIPRPPRSMLTDVLSNCWGGGTATKLHSLTEGLAGLQATQDVGRAKKLHPLLSKCKGYGVLFKI